jgi:hypothetical protein
MSVKVYFTGRQPCAFVNVKSDQSSSEHCAEISCGTTSSDRKKRRSIVFIGVAGFGLKAKIVTNFQNRKRQKQLFAIDVGTLQVLSLR